MVFESKEMFSIFFSFPSNALALVGNIFIGGRKYAKQTIGASKIVELSSLATVSLLNYVPHYTSFKYTCSRFFNFI